MHTPWPLVIAIAILCLAFLLTYGISKIVEEETSFLCIVGMFLVLYIGAAISIGFLTPKPDAILDVPSPNAPGAMELVPS